MERNDKSAYSKVLTVTSCYTEVIRKEANDDDSVGTICRYRNLANTIATKILNKNNTEFILCCEDSQITFHVIIGIPLKKKELVVKNFKLVYNDKLE